MVRHLISFSFRNRWVVLLLSAGLFGWGIWSVKNNPVDAIPDVSENQVIVFTEWAGRSPQLIEDQVTYPLVSNFQSIPKIKTVRGTSMFGMSFVYVIFEDNVDIYWARTRVLEKLNYAQRLLPEGVAPTIGPDGTGVGHIFWYTLDAKGYDLAELRALQDWYIKYGLQTVKGVSEAASFGGFQKQYQINIDPNKLSYYNISLPDVLHAVKANNNDVGGRKFEMSDMAYVVRGLGYIKSKEEIEKIPVGRDGTTPITIGMIASGIQTGGDLRLGIFDENGEGEAVGGIIVMRYGENAEEVIKNVKAKIADLEKGMDGVKFKIAYDRSELIEASIASVKKTIIEEMVVVSLIVLIFLFHFRSAFVIIIQIPVSIAASFILLQALGISSNIMSITGIALAIGVVVDDGIMMVENAYRHLADKQNEQ